jgi:hypothetical protein
MGEIAKPLFGTTGELTCPVVIIAYPFERIFTEKFFSSNELQQNLDGSCPPLFDLVHTSFYLLLKPCAFLFLFTALPLLIGCPSYLTFLIFWLRLKMLRKLNSLSPDFCHRCEYQETQHIGDEIEDTPR